MAEHMPLVSVVIPAYNHYRFIGEAIDSVLAQTYPHHEIIVVDDGSDDTTSDVVGAYEAVRYIKQRHLGPSAARNRGVQESRGEYVVFLDADDRLLPQHFHISLETFRANPDAGWVCGSIRYFGGEAPWPYRHCCDPRPDYFGSFLRSVFFGGIHAVMYRRSVFVASGGFDERLKTSEDREFYLRLIRHAPLYCHHQIVAEYRMLDWQTSRRWYAMLKSDYSMQRRQRRLVRHDRRYVEAYDDGMAFLRARYGERALWQMVADARSGRWSEAFRAFWVLVRCYPAGLLNLFKLKISKGRLARKLRSLVSSEKPDARRC